MLRKWLDHGSVVQGENRIPIMTNCVCGRNIVRTLESGRSVQKGVLVTALDVTPVSDTPLTLPTT